MSRIPTLIQTPETRTQDKLILGPVPVKLYIYASFRKKQKENAKLIRLQWDQRYGLRNIYMPVIKFDPRLKPEDIAILEIWEEKRMWISEERKIRAPTYMTRTIVKLYKPKNPETKPRAIFVVAEYPLRSTRMGGRDESELLTKDGVLWHYVDTNVSRSGRHGKKLFMVLSSEPVKIRWVSVSNRGNRRAGIDVYDFDGVKQLPELEEIETLKSWRYGKVVRMRDNLKNETFIALILEYHEARKSCARTSHEIVPEDAVELIQSSAHGSKTHWIEVYRVLRPCKVRTVRATNCGNTYEITIEVSP